MTSDHVPGTRPLGWLFNRDIERKRMAARSFTLDDILTADEQEALRIARLADALTPAEGRELRYLLGVEKLPSGGRAACVEAVLTKALLDRMIGANP